VCWIDVQGGYERDGFIVDFLQVSKSGKACNDGVDGDVPLPAGWQRHEGIINSSDCYVF